MTVGKAAHGGVVRRLARHGGLLAAIQTFTTQMFLVFINLGTGILTARLLGPDGRGLFAAATLWPQALGAVFCFGLPASIVFHCRTAEHARGTVFRAALIQGGVLSMIAVGVGLVVAPLTMSGYSRSEIILAEWTILATIPTFVMMICRQVAVSLNMFSEFNMSSYLPPLFYLISAIVVWQTVGLTVESCVLCVYGNFALFTAWLYVIVRRQCRTSSTEGLSRCLRNMIDYAARGAAVDMFSGLAGYFDRIVLMFLVTPDVLGRYALAYSFSRLILIAQTLVNSVFYTRLIGRSKDEIMEMHDHVLRLVIYVVLAATAGAWFLGQQMLTLLYGRDFASAHGILVVLTIEAGLTCIGQVTLQAFHAVNRPGFASIAQTAGFVTALGGVFLLVPAFGAMGAAAAMALAATVRLGVLISGFSAQLRVPRLYPLRSDLDHLYGLFRA